MYTEQCRVQIYLNRLLPVPNNPCTFQPKVAILSFRASVHQIHDFTGQPGPYFPSCRYVLVGFKPRFRHLFSQRVIHRHFNKHFILGLDWFIIDNNSDSTKSLCMWWAGAIELYWVSYNFTLYIYMQFYIYADSSTFNTQQDKLYC